MPNMKIPEEVIALLEAHLEPTEAARAINALNDLLFGAESRFQARQIQFMEELKSWLSTELATKSEVAGIEVRIKEEMAGIRERLSRVETRIEGLEERIDGLDEKIGALDRKIDERTEALDRKIDEKVGILDRKIDEKVETLERKIDEKVGALDRKIDEKVGALDRKVGDRIDALEKRMATREDLARLDKKFTVYFMILLFTVIFLNQNALEFIARLFGLVK